MHGYVFLAFATIYPAIAILSWVRNRDQLLEPRDVVVKTAIFGGIAVIPILVIEIFLAYALDLPADFTSIDSIGQAFLMGFVVAAFTEESFKFFVLRGYAARHDAFDEPFDGIVYGVAASLGFAIVENVVYVFGEWQESGLGAGITVAILRALTAVPMHAICGVIMGACIGIGRFKPWRGWMLLGYIGAIGVHGAYDTFLFSMFVPSVAAESSLVMLCIGGFLMVFLFGLVVSGLAIARMRRDQTRRIETQEAMIVPPPPFPSSAVAVKGTEGVPGWPMVSMVLAAMSAVIFVVGIVAAILMVDSNGNLDEGSAGLVGIALLGSLAVTIIAIPVSTVALLREPRWRAASILSILCCVAELLLVLGLIAISIMAE